MPEDRDFFLVMPDETRESTKKVEATYADGMVLSRAFFSQLKARQFVGSELVCDTETNLLDKATVPYWTEHSPRPTLPSWVSCLACFPTDWPDLLGRWGASKAEGYVRTHRVRVHRMQEAVSERFRTDIDPHSAFDEDALFDEIRTYFMRKQVDPDIIESQLARLRVKTACKSDEADEQHITTEDDKVVSDDEEVKVCRVSAMVEPEEDPERDLNGLFVVGVSGAVRRLHQVGRCWRYPGVDYVDFVVYGTQEPDADQYTAKCRFCWPAKRMKASSFTASRAPPSSADSSSSGSSTSSD